MNRRTEHDIARKLKVLNYAKEIGNVSKTCRYFGICRELFISGDAPMKRMALTALP